MAKERLFICIAVGCVSLALLFYFSTKKSSGAYVCEEQIVQEAVTADFVAETPQLPDDVDRMSQLFDPYSSSLPIVETVSYTGKVDWLSGRQAYIGDYASHYKTSKHFISRSLHGAGVYFSGVVSKGDRFNVLRADKDIEFHLVLDLSRLKMWLYYFDKGEDQRVLLKSYQVGAGRMDQSSESGFLTPLGTFLLGDEIAVYKPDTIGTYKNEQVEMISVFGTRWIPINRAIGWCRGSYKGIGIHGIPWNFNSETNEFVEKREDIGYYDSNGCIRLLSEDMEEIFSLIVSRPAYLHIVKDFFSAVLPGQDKS